MSEGKAALNDWISRLRELPELAQRSAPGIAVVLRQEVVQSARAQTGPDGRPWQAAKDGQPMMQNMEKSLRVVAVDKTIVATLDNHHALHHVGRAKGKIARPMLPTRDIPDPAVKAIQRVVTGEFQKIMGGR